METYFEGFCESCKNMFKVFFIGNGSFLWNLRKNANFRLLGNNRVICPMCLFFGDVRRLHFLSNDGGLFFSWRKIKKHGRFHVLFEDFAVVTRSMNFLRREILEKNRMHVTFCERHRWKWKSWPLEAALGCGNPLSILGEGCSTKAAQDVRIQYVAHVVFLIPRVFPSRANAMERNVMAIP